MVQRAPKRTLDHTRGGGGSNRLRIAGFADSVGFGLGVLVIGPIAIVLYLAFIRMALEFYLAITRMSQDINQRLPQR